MASKLTVFARKIGAKLPDPETPEMTSLSGIADLIRFLQHLDDHAVWYHLDRCGSDSVMVTFTLIGKRIELDFFDDHVEYSVFGGDESVLDDMQWLFGQIKSFGVD